MLTWISKPNCKQHRTACRTFASALPTYLLQRNGLCRTILDVGGVGMSAVWLALLYPDAIIYRLEPNPSNFEIGVINSINMPNIRQFNIGLWNNNTIVQMCNLLADDWGSDWPFEDETGHQNAQQQVSLLHHIVCP